MSARTDTASQQLRLTLVPAQADPVRRLPRSRNARMALRLDALVKASLDEAADLRLSGRLRAARQSEERAEAARRAAAILRRGPGGVGELLAS